MNMASNSNSPTQSATQQALGREYAIMLGAQPLSGLASLINWSNSSSYQRPTLEPWGNIATSSNLEQVAPVGSSTEPSAIATGADVPSTSSAPTATTEVVAPIAAPTIQTAPPTPAPVIPEPVAQEPLTAKLPEPTPEVIRQVPVIAEPVIVEPVVKEAVVTIPVVAEVITAPVVREEPKSVASPEPASIKKVVAPEPEQVASIVPQSAIVEPPVVQAAEPVQPKPIPTPIPKPTLKQNLKPTPEPQLASPAVRPSITPRRIAASSMPEWKPTAKVNRPSDSNSTGDEYLHQLERLIIELNMELGMRDGDSPSQETDQMSLLVQRMIDLNLQNLALKEQLREAASPTL
jgi:hypothetical protein